MHNLIKKRFKKDVESLNEGQLLQFGITREITPMTVITHSVRVPTGRGDFVGYQVSVICSFADAPLIKVTVNINGKDVTKDMPATAYFLQFAVNETATTGAQRIAKTIYPISEGSVVRVTVSSGNASGFLQLDGFLTDKFIPQKMTFNYSEYFEHIATAGNATDKEFVLPTARGRIVGIALITNTAGEGLDDPRNGANLLINGVSILENFNPVKYIGTNNMLQTNNWIVNIQGGATMRSVFDNPNGEDVLLGYIMYFSEELESKYQHGAKRKQLDIKS